jgi:hypothetical protein
MNNQTLQTSCFNGLLEVVQYLMSLIDETKKKLKKKSKLKELKKSTNVNKILFFS